MSQTILAYPDAARVGLDMMVKEFTEGKNLIYPLMGFVRVNTKQSFIQTVEEPDLGFMDAVNEDQSSPEDSYELRNKKQHPWYIYKKKLTLSKYKIESDQTGVYSASNQARKLMESGIKTYEAIHCNVFNGSFSTVLVGDGKPLCDAPTLGQGGHPLDGGLIQHNRGYYNGSTYAEVSFSETGVESLSINMAQYISHRGQTAALLGPYDIICGPKLMYAADRLRKTDQTLGSNNNDKNVIRQRIGDTVVHPLIITSSWWLRDTREKSPLNTLMFQDIDKWVKADDDRTNVSMGINAALSAIASNWRGLHGTFVA